MIESIQPAYFIPKLNNILYMNFLSDLLFWSATKVFSKIVIKSIESLIETFDKV